MSPAAVGPRYSRRIERVIRSVLPPKVEVQVLKSHGPTVHLKLAGHRIRARWVGAGLPGDVRSILNDTGPHPDVVVARRVSPGTREALARHGIGWADELGAAEIAIGTVVVSRTGRAPSPLKKSGRWSPAVVAVAEALLCQTRATVAAIQRATGLSTGSATNALRVLTEARLLEAGSARGRTSARRVVSVDKLLDAYALAAASRGPSTSLVVGVTWRDPVAGLAELGQQWTRLGIEWAATGAVAAAVLAPLLTTVSSALVYVSGDTSAELEALAARAQLRPIEGGRLTLVPFPTVTTRRLARVTDGLRLAPWPRVYADLRAIGVRGEEAAEHLREVLRGG